MKGISERSMSQEYVCIGIDIGGTNTDAVLLQGLNVIAASKVNTSPDITAGVTAAIQDLFKFDSVSKKDVDAVVIGTTHFVNSVLHLFLHYHFILKIEQLDCYISCVTVQLHIQTTCCRVWRNFYRTLCWILKHYQKHPFPLIALSL